jgi:hypothetical protein
MQNGSTGNSVILTTAYFTMRDANFGEVIAEVKKAPFLIERQQDPWSGVLCTYASS